MISVVRMYYIIRYFSKVTGRVFKIACFCSEGHCEIVEMEDGSFASVCLMCRFKVLISLLVEVSSSLASQSSKFSLVKHN